MSRGGNRGSLVDPTSQFAPLSAVTRSVNLQTGTTYTTVLADSNNVIRLNNALGGVVTIPPNATVAYGVPCELNFENDGVGDWTVVGGGAAVVTPEPGMSAVIRAGGSASALQDVTNAWKLAGTLIPADVTTLLATSANPGLARWRQLVAKTASFTLAAADAQKAHVMTATATGVVTVPLNATVPIPNGYITHVIQASTGKLSLAPEGAAILLRQPAKGLVFEGKGALVRLEKIATDTWLVDGDLIDFSKGGQAIVSTQFVGWSGGQTATLAAGSVYGRPIRIIRGGTLAQHRINVNTAGSAGSKARIGWYTMTDLWTGDLLIDCGADLDCTGTGVKQNAPAGPPYLPPGVFLLVVFCATASFVAKAVENFGGDPDFVPPYPSGDVDQSGLSGTHAWIGGALPSTVTLTTASVLRLASITVEGA